MNRRDVLKGALGAFTMWTSSRVLNARQASDGVRRLTDTLSVINAGTNVVAFSNSDGMILVDTGDPQSSAALKGATPVRTIFNTHYHLENTASNEAFGQAGAKIIAHERTRQWMSTDYWVPDQDRFEKARPKAARPTQTFKTTGSMTAGAEQIEYGYLPMAHTSGDIYVFFKTSNVLAVGDVASPVRDPALDYFTGGWIGGRVEAMDLLLKLANEQTRIVPGFGPVMTRAQFKAERDVMEEVRVRLWKQVREGLGPKEMLDGGLMSGLPRTWKDPYKFLYDAAKGMWAHHNKLDPNVV